MFFPLLTPIQRASFFLLLSLSLESFPKLSITVRAAVRDFFDPSNINVVSSAY